MGKWGKGLTTGHQKLEAKLSGPCFKSKAALGEEAVFYWFSYLTEKAVLEICPKPTFKKANGKIGYLRPLHTEGFQVSTWARTAKEITDQGAGIRT